MARREGTVHAQIDLYVTHDLHENRRKFGRIYRGEETAFKIEKWIAVCYLSKKAHSGHESSKARFLNPDLFSH